MAPLKSWSDSDRKLLIRATFWFVSCWEWDHPIDCSCQSVSRSVAELFSEAAAVSESPLTGKCQQNDGVKQDCGSESSGPGSLPAVVRLQVSHRQGGGEERGRRRGGGGEREEEGGGEREEERGRRREGVPLNLSAELSLHRRDWVLFSAGGRREVEGEEEGAGERGRFQKVKRGMDGK
ncbi:unnamed protein product [Pleuronectes platessa]|uniref:Uncharacterized protein n=1 Tax=Pleuronectes platessa TaxID=8262 RepID=A0A9N7VLD7_PLEPL|nr:unnamed protein product [Pleuronectes platessa]